MELNCLFFIWMSSLQNDVATRGWYDDDPHCTVAAVAADEGVGTQLTRPHSPLQRSRYIKKTNFKTGFLRSCPKGLWNPGVCTENLDLLSSCRRTFEIWSLFWNNLDLFWACALGLLKSGDCTENLDLLLFQEYVCLLNHSTIRKVCVETKFFWSLLCKLKLFYF